MHARRTLYSLPVKLSAGAALVALADLFFYNHPMGWAAGLYGMAMLAAIAALQGGLLRHWQSRLITLMLCGLSAALVLSPEPLSLSLFAAGIVALLILHKHPLPPDTSVWIKDVVLFVWRIFQQWNRDRGLLRLLRRRRKIPELRWTAGAIFTVVPASLAIVFMFLFAQANPVIGRILNAIDWEVLEDLFAPWRCMFWFSVGITVWAILRPRFRAAQASAPAALPNLDRWFNPASVTASLALFNLIFAVQNGLDITFLWSGAPLPEGLSYAEYAHAGAYPLIITALLAAAYILITFGDRKYQTPVTRALVYLWIAQNVFLVVSSIDRDLNYIAVYSLTYLRLSALIWMGLVACGLGLIVVKIQFARSNMWLINRNMLALVAVLYACCFVNFDSVIANYNVRHAQEVVGSGGMLDMGYMQSLGPEAVPALRWFRDHARFSPWQAATAGAMADTMEQNLAADMARDWHSWTWRNEARIEDMVTRPPPAPRPLGHTGWQLKE